METMDAEIFRAIHPKQFVKSFLEHGLRPDGRAVFETRKRHIASGAVKSSDASAAVRIGSTSVLCGVKLEVGRPADTAPRDGRLVVMVHMTPLCSPKLSVGRATDESVAIGELIGRIVRSAKLFVPEELCIAEGKAAWVIYADVVVLDHDGAVLDAALMALVHALRQLRLPQTTIDEKGTVWLVPSSEPGRPLPTLPDTPTALTFASLETEVIADPTAAEQELSDSVWTIVTCGKQVAVYKAGGTPLSDELLRKCMDAAAKLGAGAGLGGDKPRSAPGAGS